MRKIHFDVDRHKIDEFIRIEMAFGLLLSSDANEKRINRIIAIIFYLVFFCSLESCRNSGKVRHWHRAIIIRQGKSKLIIWIAYFQLFSFLSSFSIFICDFLSLLCSFPIFVWVNWEIRICIDGIFWLPFRLLNRLCQTVSFRCDEIVVFNLLNSEILHTCSCSIHGFCSRFIASPSCSYALCHRRECHDCVVAVVTIRCSITFRYHFGKFISIAFTLLQTFPSFYHQHFLSCMGDKNQLFMNQRNG